MKGEEISYPTDVRLFIAKDRSGWVLQMGDSKYYLSDRTAKMIAGRILESDPVSSREWNGLLN